MIASNKLDIITDKIFQKVSLTGDEIKFLQYPKWERRLWFKNIVMDPKTPGYVLNQLAKLISYNTEESVAHIIRHPNIDTDTLASIIHNSKIINYLKLDIVKCKQLTADLTLQLIESLKGIDDLLYLGNVAQHSRYLIIMTHLMFHGTAFVRLAVAENNECSNDILEILTNDTNVKVGITAMENLQRNGLSCYNENYSS